MFGRKKEIQKVADPYYDDEAYKLVKKVNKDYNNLELQAQETYIIEESIKVFVGTDLEQEKKELENQKEKLRNLIACYDLSRTEYHNYVNAHQISFAQWPTSHDVVHTAIKRLFRK